MKIHATYFQIDFFMTYDQRKYDYLMWISMETLCNISFYVCPYTYTHSILKLFLSAIVLDEQEYSQGEYQI